MLTFQNEGTCKSKRSCKSNQIYTQRGGGLQIKQINTKSASHRVNGFLLPTVKSDSFDQIPKNNSINRVSVVENKQIEPSCWVFKLDQMESNPATLLKSMF